MDTNEIVITVVVVVVVLALIALAVWMMRSRRTKQRVEHADQLRQEAHQHATGIPEAEVRAREAEVEAERKRLEAEKAQHQAREAQVAAAQQQATHEDRLRAADQVDPRVDTASDDYTPGSTPAAGHENGTARTSDPDTVLDADDRRTDTRETISGTDTTTTRTTDSTTDGPTGGTHRA